MKDASGYNGRGIDRDYEAVFMITTAEMAIGLIKRVDNPITGD
jgi:hypothetical protein